MGRLIKISQDNSNIDALAQEIYDQLMLVFEHSRICQRDTLPPTLQGIKYILSSYKSYSWEAFLSDSFFEKQRSISRSMFSF
jgi:hypothetical protein